MITVEDVNAEEVAGLVIAPAYEEDSEGLLTLRELEKRHILRALEESQGDRTQAARLLQIGRATVFRKIKGYKLDA